MNVPSRRDGLLAVGVTLVVATVAVAQEEQRSVSPRAKLSWDSPRMRDLEREWELLQDAPRDAVLDKNPKGLWQEYMTRRFMARRLSREDVSDLAASCNALPADPKEWGMYGYDVLAQGRSNPTYRRLRWGAFVYDVFAHMFWNLDRTALVELLSQRCPYGVGNYNMEFALALREGSGARLRRAPPLLAVLGEAYSRCETPQVRRELARAVRRGFAGSGIQGKDDAEYVANAMQWFAKNKDHLVLNWEYHWMFYQGPPTKLEEDPGCYERSRVSEHGQQLLKEKPASEASPSRPPEWERAAAEGAPGPPDVAKSRTPEQALADLQGTWNVVEIADVAGPFPEEKFKGCRFVFRGSVLTEYEPDGAKRAEYRIRLGSRQEPQAMDLIRTVYELRPKNKDELSALDRLIQELNEETTPLLYELNGDSLRICYPSPHGMLRPTSFKAEEGSGRTLITLKHRKGGAAKAALGAAALALGLSGWLLPYGSNVLRLRGGLAGLFSDRSNRAFPRILGTLLCLLGTALLLGTFMSGGAG